MDKPVIGVNAEGCIVQWNASAVALYGYEADEILGRPVYVVYPLGPAVSPEHPLNFDHGADDIESIEALHKTRDGRFIMVDFSVHRHADEAKVDAEYTLTIHRVSRGSGTENEVPSPEAGQLWTLAVVETAVEAIVTIDERGIIEYFNPAAERLFGYRREEVSGQNVNILMPGPYAGEHDGYIANYLHSGARKIIGIGRDVVGRRKDGSTFPVHLAVSEVWLGAHRIFTGIIHDTTQRHQAQDEKDRLLRELNRRNRELTCLYRLEEVVRTVEQESEMFAMAVELLHAAITLPSVTGTRIVCDGRTYVTKSFQDTPWKIRADIVVDGRHRGDVEIHFLEGAVSEESGMSLEGEQNLLDTVSELLGATIERREAEAKVIHASKLASVGELAAGVGHEINNPVNGIINCAHILMEQTEAGTKSNEFARLIHGEGERIARIVQSLLAYSRQDKEQHSLASLNDIVDVVMSLCQKRLVKSHIKLSIVLAEDLPQFRCRSEQLQQVLMNLVINATHALDERYPGADENKQLNVIASRLDIEGSRGIRIVVEDHGSGVAPEHLDRIFDPFFTTKGRDSGTGLGLSVSDGIVKSHNGVMRVESVLNGGTRMIIDLPVDGDAPIGA